MKSLMTLFLLVPTILSATVHAGEMKATYCQAQAEADAQRQLGRDPGVVTMTTRLTRGNSDQGTEWQIEIYKAALAPDYVLIETVDIDSPAQDCTGTLVSSN